MNRPDEKGLQGSSSRLRQALEPSRQTVERVVEGALAGSGRGLASRARWAAAWAVVALVALVALVLVRGTGFQPPRSPSPSEPAISIHNVGELVVVQRGRGGGHLLRSNGAADQAKVEAGSSRIIIRRGERP